MGAAFVQRGTLVHLTTIQMSSIASETEIDMFSPTTLGSPLPLEDRPGGYDGSSGSVYTGTGVGLSNPHLSQGRRRMLDLVNRLHTTGYVLDILTYDRLHKCSPIIVSR
jgi:hypothetical protein